MQRVIAINQSITYEKNTLINDSSCNSRAVTGLFGQ
jgi:hypothetical protein